MFPYPKTVAEAALQLDEFRPNWVELITGPFCMWQPNACVLCYIGKESNRSWMQLLEHLYNRSARTRGGSIYASFQDAWEVEIQQRRGLLATPSPKEGDMFVLSVSQADIDKANNLRQQQATAITEICPVAQSLIRKGYKGAWSAASCFQVNGAAFQLPASVTTKIYAYDDYKGMKPFTVRFRLKPCQ